MEVAKAENVFLCFVLLGGGEPRDWERLGKGAGPGKLHLLIIDDTDDMKGGAHLDTSGLSLVFC